MPTDYVALVRDVARELNLLDESGKVLPLDSLAMIDLVVAIETAAQVAIPAAHLTPRTFESVESIATFLSQIAANGPPP